MNVKTERPMCGEVYQFLSRQNIPDLPTRTSGSNLINHPEIAFKMDYELCDKPFELNFAQIHPSNPCIGAFEYLDPLLDRYMSKRWPRCIKGTATIVGTSFHKLGNQIIREILLHLKKDLWSLKDTVEYQKYIERILDQTSTTMGYRRGYIHHQLFDIAGNRPPSSSRFYVPAEPGEYIGPGLSYLHGVSGIAYPNELVWSAIIPFKGRKDVRTDLPMLEKQIMEIRKHFNSYSELENAKRYLKAGDIKGCVRASACSVDAILRYYCNAWGIKFHTNSNKRMQYDAKIEDILYRARKPSYRKVDSENLQKLLYLYRARTSEHEGDCYYKDVSGKIIRISRTEQAANFLKATETFTIWIDSII